MRENQTSLQGDGTYSWGHHSQNPVTTTQRNIIKFIEEMTPHRFTGCTSRQAYAFIQEHHNEAKYCKKSKRTNYSSRTVVFGSYSHL